MSAVLDEPVKPGMVKMIQLANEGRLAKGDKVETQRLGVCTVAYIRSANGITVKDARGCYHSLEIEWGGEARLEDAAA